MVRSERRATRPCVSSVPAFLIPLSSASLVLFPLPRRPRVYEFISSILITRRSSKASGVQAYRQVQPDKLDMVSALKQLAEVAQNTTNGLPRHHEAGDLCLSISSGICNAPLRPSSIIKLLRKHSLIPSLIERLGSAVASQDHALHPMMLCYHGLMGPL